MTHLGLSDQVSAALSQLTMTLQHVSPSWTEDYSICLVSFVNSLMFHTVIYLVFSPILSRTFKSYREGSEATKIEWDSRVVSNVHAILWVLLCSYSIFVEDAFPTFAFDESSKMARFAVLYAGGYFAYDLILILKHYKSKCQLKHHCDQPNLNFEPA